MGNWLAEPAAQRLSLSLVHFVWQGAALAVVLSIALRWPRAGSQFRYLASLSALGLMAACPIVTYLAVDFPAAAENRSFVVPPSGGPATGEATMSRSPLAAELSAVGELVAANRQLVLSLWLAGVSLLGARLLGSYAGTLWLRSEQVALPPRLAQRVAVLGRRLNVQVAGVVHGSSHVAQAVAVGLWRPVVLLPLSWLSELPPDVLEAVIAHELAHIRRWDLWATLLQRTIETLLFYHPAVWWVSRRASLEREMCCDELAVAATGQRMAYAQALETVGRRAAGVSWSLATSFNGETHMNLLKRVRHILGLRPDRESAVAWPAGMLALGVAVAIWCNSTASVTSQALADEDKKAAPREGEREKDVKRSPEAESKARKSPEAEAGARKSAEVDAVRNKLNDAKARKIAEPDAARTKEGDVKFKAIAEEKRELDEAKKGSYPDAFKPQTDREAALFKMIQQLQKEVAMLRQEVYQSRDRIIKDGDKGATRKEGDKGAIRDGDKPKTIQRDGDKVVKPGARDGEVLKKPAARDGDQPKPGSREGDAPVKKGPRDGDQPAKEGARDGDAPRKDKDSQ